VDSRSKLPPQSTLSRPVRLVSSVPPHTQVQVAQRPRLLDRVREAVRSRRYSYRTEEAYVGWIKRFIVFHGQRHPREMGAPEVSRFLTSLAVDRKVAASTQNQALAAILFLYKEVLERDPGWYHARYDQRHVRRRSTSQASSLARVILTQNPHPLSRERARVRAIRLLFFLQIEVQRQHVLPKGFMRIRHYGITANRHRDGVDPILRQFSARNKLVSAGSRRCWL
jgi:hypothetical protein